MNEIVNNFLLVGDIFIPKTHLKQPTLLDKTGFTYSVCDPLTKSKKSF